MTKNLKISVLRNKADRKAVNKKNKTKNKGYTKKPWKEGRKEGRKGGTEVKERKHPCTMDRRKKSIVKV